MTKTIFTGVVSPENLEGLLKSFSGCAIVRYQDEERTWTTEIDSDEEGECSWNDQVDYPYLGGMQYTSHSGKTRLEVMPDGSWEATIPEMSYGLIAHLAGIGTMEIITERPITWWHIIRSYLKNHSCGVMPHEHIVIHAPNIRKRTWLQLSKRPDLKRELILEIGEANASRYVI